MRRLILLEPGLEPGIEPSLVPSTLSTLPPSPSPPTIVHVLGKGIPSPPPPPSDSTWSEISIAESTAPRRLLGSTFPVVVVWAPANSFFTPNTLGLVHGLIPAHGTLILVPSPSSPLSRFETRFSRILQASTLLSPPSPPTSLLPPSPPIPPSQATLAASIADSLTPPSPHLWVLTADRGRGKSATIGLALAAALSTQPELSIQILAPSPSAVQEIFTFAPSLSPSSSLTTLSTLLSALAGDYPDVLVIDEAAQFPIPVLQSLIQRLAPTTALILASTTHGYEGTGRGFELKFLAWLKHHPSLIPFTRATLSSPIRWFPDDPLEAFINRALCLDLDLLPLPSSISLPQPQDTVFEHLSKDVLGEDDAVLDEVYALLHAAHYRTTPNDLEKLLDAENMELYVCRDPHSTRILAANVVALEGGAPPETFESYRLGKVSTRGQALVDTLTKHMGYGWAAGLTYLRSVRTATHPSARRQGYASHLIRCVEAVYETQVDLFGTLFGGTQALLTFRRNLGYLPIRLAASRGARSAEPSVCMLRPITPLAHVLVTAAQADLALSLPKQLELHTASNYLPLSSSFTSLLSADLPILSDPPYTPTQLCEIVASNYAYGAQVDESVMALLELFLTTFPDAATDAQLHPRDVALLQTRVIQCLPLDEAGIAADPSAFPTGRSAARSLRRIFRSLVDVVHPRPLPPPPP